MKAAWLLVLAAAGALAVAGCTSRAEQRARDAWHDVTGQRPQHAQVDLNTATQRELSRLPGLTDDDAARIVAHRPYGSRQGLLRKGVIGEGKYQQIEDDVYVSQAR